MLCIYFVVCSRISRVFWVNSAFWQAHFLFFLFSFSLSS